MSVVLRGFEVEPVEIGKVGEGFLDARLIQSEFEIDWGQVSRIIDKVWNGKEEIGDHGWQSEELEV